LESILLAMDESANAMRAVEYVARLSSSGARFQVSMVGVLVKPSPDLFEEPQGAERFAAEYRGRMEKVFARAREILTGAGLPAAQVRHSLIETEDPGVAQALLAEQRKGGYGTIVVGRRGVTKAEEFLFGSVSNKIIHHAKDCTVWVVE